MVATHDLHGSAPDSHPFVVLVIDMINGFEFEGADKLLKDAMKAAKSLARLLPRARKAGVPIIYINDNFGRWQSDFRAQLQRCLRKRCPGAPIAKLLKPLPGDYYVLKPKHSGFYATPLNLLLASIGARHLVFTGLTTESCVYFTASDAYLREYEIIVLSDCVASSSASRKSAALDMMSSTLKATVKKAKELRLET